LKNKQAKEEKKKPSKKLCESRKKAAEVERDDD